MQILNSGEVASVDQITDLAVKHENIVVSNNADYLTYYAELLLDNGTITLYIGTPEMFETYLREFVMDSETQNAPV